MKRLILTLLLTFGFAYIFIPSQLYATQEKGTKYTIQQQILLHKSKKQTERTITQLTQSLHVIIELINYWNQQQLMSFPHTLTKVPSYWFSSTCSNDIETKLSFLHQEYDTFVYFLGKLSIWNDQLDSTTTDFDDFLLLIYQHINLINDCLTILNGRTKETLIYQNNHPLVITQESILSLYHNNQERLESYDAEFNNSIAPYQKPSHLQRNWLFYTAGACGTLAMLYYLYKNPDTIPGLNKSMHDFYRNYIILPFKTVYNIVFKQQSIDQQPLGDHVVTYEGYQESINDFAQSFRTYLKECHSALSDQQCEEYIQSAIENGESAFLNEQINKELKNPVLNIAAGKEIKVGALIIKLVMIKSNATFYQLHKIKRAFNLFAPLAFMIGAGLYVGKKIIAPRLPATRARIEIRNIVHIIHQTINNQPDLTDNLEVSYKYYGTLTYWTEQLKANACYIDLSLRRSFLDDSRILSRPGTTREQKLATIDQMYRRYDFLKNI